MSELVHIGDSDISKREYKNRHDNGLNYRSVYVAMATDGLVKVGVSKNYNKRERELSRTMHGKIMQNFTTEKCLNAFEVEKEVHNRLCEYRYFGEWYDVDFEYVVNLVKDVFAETALFESNTTEETRAKYQCNTLLDYFHRNEVLVD